MCTTIPRARHLPEVATVVFSNAGTVYSTSSVVAHCLPVLVFAVATKRSLTVLVRRMCLALRQCLRSPLLRDRYEPSGRSGRPGPTLLLVPDDLNE